MPEVSFWTLRFTSCQAEEGYLLRSQVGLIKRFSCLAQFTTVASTALAAPLVLMLAGLLGEQPMQGLRRQLTIIVLCGTAVCALLSCLTVVAMRFSRCWVKRVRPWTLEAVVIAAGVLVMCIAVLCNSPQMVKILGLTLQEVLGEDAYDSDSWTVLSIQGVSMAMHLGVPLRWCFLLTLEIASIVLYVVAVFVLGSSEPPLNVFCNTLALTGLVAASSFGKRASELLERKGFLDMIQEKQMRCRAEFELSRVQEHSNSPASATPPIDVVAESSVAARTAGSSHIFDPRALHSEGSIGDHLAHLAQVGTTEQWRLEDSQVTVIEDELLGSGGFGEVRKGVFCGQLVAIKRPRIKAENTDAETLGGICNELRVTRHLKHPNIVTTFGAIVQPDELSVSLVMELVDGVRLTDLMRAATADRRCEVSPVKRFQIMVGVCQALFYMHTRRPSIAHGDLKGDNIMVTLGRGTAHPKLLDFGLSRVLTRNARKLGGTLAWMAPEVARRRGVVKCSADIYSFGHVIAFTATSNPPGRGLAADTIRRILWRSTPLAPRWPAACAFRPSCEPLVNECINKAERDRPKIDEVHRRLLSLPEEPALAEMHGPFIDGLQVMAGLLRRPAGAPWSGTEQPEPNTPAAQPELQEVDSGTQLHSSHGSLRSLPEGEAVEHEDEEGGDPAPPPPPPPRPPKLQPHPNFEETCQEGRIATLDAVLARWNYQVPKKFCCERHALANLAVDTLRKHVLAKPCNFRRLPRAAEQAQCGNCGVLLEAGGAQCDACGFGGPQSQSSDSSDSTSRPATTRTSL